MSVRYPFGDPEGARSDILDSFIDFSGSEWGDLAMRPDDRMVRVIVGAKGSGKTVFLRRLHAHAVQAAGQTKSTYAEKNIPTDPPDTDLIVRFCEDERSPELTEAWSRIWHRAILRSLTTHFTTVGELRSCISADLESALRNNYSKLLGEYRNPRSIYDQLTAILREYRHRHALHEYVNDPQWGDLEYDLANALRDVPPLFFYLDYLDEKFEAAPMHWHRCQLGLFDRVMAILRDQAFGGRLHVVIAVRDIVYASLLRSEHRGRYIDQPHIRLLNWDRHAVRYFLDRKIDSLEATHLLAPASDSPIARWLGTPTVRNEKRAISEDAYTYLLRHTRLLPRDIVTLGNEISVLIANTKAEGAKQLDEKRLRAVVRKAAAGFGQEQLSVCAGHLAALALPHGAAREGYADFYIGSKDYRKQFATHLIDLLRVGARKDRLTWPELDTLRRLAQDTIAADLDLPSVLWQNGLLGYVGDGEQGPRHVFFPTSGELGFTLPSDRAEYVFHSCLIDAVGLKAVGASPVYPDLGIG